MRVLIVGAGIGGLSAAIALQRRGIEAVLVERTTELKEIGAGIAIAANAMKALDSLGLADAVRHNGAEPQFYEIRSWRGEVLSRVSVSEQREKLGATSVAAHRADLQAALLQGLAEAGARCISALSASASSKQGGMCGHLSLAAERSAATSWSALTA